MTADEPARYSHPPEGTTEATTLHDHLSDVADRCDVLTPDAATTARGEDIGVVSHQVGWCHDLGKLTTWFQQYIGMTSGSPSEDKPTTHSFFGAHAAYYCLEASGRSPKTCLAGYLAVAKHHGALPDAIDYIYDKYRDNPSGRRNRQEVIEQTKNIDEEVPETADTLIQAASLNEGSWEGFRGRIEEGTVFDAVRNEVSGGSIVSTRDPDALPREFYDDVLRIWSVLVLADKTSAAGAPMIQGDRPQQEVLRGYIDGLGDAESSREERLNKTREQARQAVLANVEDFVRSDEDVATLTLPTGLGKTLTGLDAALDIRDAREGSRVIYALPFTSIVDQVAGEMGSIWSSEPGDAMLTVHHHLADTTIDPEKVAGAGEDATDAGADVEAMLGKSWRSGLVVTTFVQLFESLAGPENSAAMKLPALYDSVVVLDEPQSLPHAWWSLVERLLEILTERYDATVLAMTATQPALFEDVPELVDDIGRYYEDDTYHRVRYRLDDSVGRFSDGDPVEYQEAASRVVAASRDTSALAVCNTIDSAQHLTDEVASDRDPVDVGAVYDEVLSGDTSRNLGEAIADAVEGNGDLGLLHLSTRLRPIDRMRLITTAKELTSRGYPLIAVTTQLIEAGVDISFGRVFRDLAPMDSVVQAAGRCNRNFERERGDVTVWWLAAPGDRELTPGAAVYDRFSGNSLLSLTADVLGDLMTDDGTVSEDTIAWEGVKQYYRELSRRNPGRDDMAEWVNRAQAAQLRGASLIDTRRSVEVVVCRTQSDWQRAEDARNAWADGRYRDVDEALDGLRSRQVSVPIYDDDGQEADMVREIPPLHDDADLRVLDAREGHRFFDASQGLIVTDDTVEARFL